MSAQFLIFLCVLILIHSSSAACKDFWPNCDGKTNTVCKRGMHCGIGGDCQKEIPSDPEFRKFMVTRHNELRNNVAMGNDTRGGNAKAANMMAMSYDMDLEYTMRCWINTCTWDHDECGTTTKYDYNGQNLYKGNKKNPPAQAMTGWYEEIQYTTADVLKAYKDPPSLPAGKMIGHYTALVWAKSTHVGCWRSFSTDNMTFLGCNYGPGSNMIGSPVYELGEPCSKCPQGVKCNAKYPGLCGEITLAAVSHRMNLTLLFFLIIIPLFTLEKIW